MALDRIPDAHPTAQNREPRIRLTLLPHRWRFYRFRYVDGARLLRFGPLSIYRRGRS